MFTPWFENTETWTTRDGEVAVSIDENELS
jgi:hypothetical protein